MFSTAGLRQVTISPLHIAQDMAKLSECLVTWSGLHPNCPTNYIALPAWLDRGFVAAFPSDAVVQTLCVFWHDESRARPPISGPFGRSLIVGRQWFQKQIDMQCLHWRLSPAATDWPQLN